MATEKGSTIKNIYWKCALLGIDHIRGIDRLSKNSHF